MKTIDILYPVRDMRVEDCKDLNISMNFFLENDDYDINFCVYDVGYSKSEEKLKKYIEHDFKYGHSRFTGHYGLSKAINLGVQELVETDIFIITDFTSIVSSQTIQLVMNKFKETNFTTYSEEFTLKDDIDINTSFQELLKEENFLSKQTKNSLFKLLSKEIFYLMGGYDEEYTNIENEENDFLLRSFIIQGKIIIDNKDKIFILKKFSNKKYKIIKSHEHILMNRIKEFKNLNILERNLKVIILNKRRQKKKIKLTEEQINSLYSKETSLKKDII